ncbi:MAG: hypothetical protein BGO01_09170 [Armatimonadetes bacterium 55-13]|nr:MAG: hypothetical protein ABT09_00635 [bacterium SCN 57-13]OJU62183.1 MAG: hypothetical protein BGO01_09170 [Armatimonadetes bacterium 55-13]
MEVKRRIAVGVGLSILVAGTIWLASRPHELVSAARDLTGAMRDGDAARLMRYADPIEISASDLTEEKIRRLWEVLVKPHLDSSRPLNTSSAQLESNGFQASAALGYADHTGKPWKLATYVTRADGKPRTPLVYSMLSMSSCFDENERISSLTNESSLVGLHKYRAQLDSIGIRRIMLNPQRVVTLDELDTIFQRHLRSEK